MKIVTIFEDKGCCLSEKAAEISLTETGIQDAQNISKQLIETLTPLMPAAGLAAPQIGISKQVFIYSWDRSLEHMDTVMNPKIISASPDTQRTWEACFSTMSKTGMSKAALVTRPKSIVVEYFRLTGEKVTKKLEGFSAKVFQHEYDHLQGLENINKEGAEVKTFDTEAALVDFLKSVKKEDSIGYTEPIDVK